MEEIRNNDFSQGTVTFCRSKRKLSIVARWYLRLLWTFIFVSLALYVSIFFIDGRFVYDSTCIWIAIILSSAIALADSLCKKGSLVDTITIDHQKQEIRVQCYNQFKRERRVTIPFDGFSWNVQTGGTDASRIRLFPKTGRRIILAKSLWAGHKKIAIS